MAEGGLGGGRGVERMLANWRILIQPRDLLSKSGNYSMFQSSV